MKTHIEFTSTNNLKHVAPIKYIYLSTTKSFDQTITFFSVKILDVNVYVQQTEFERIKSILLAEKPKRKKKDAKNAST